jgi:glycogen(starch) synthase
MTSGMRILMTTDTIGGVWSYALELAEGLCQSGHQVALATLGAPLDGGQWAQARAIGGLQVFESRYQLEWMDDPWDDVARSGEWLMWLAERLRPDVVHLNTFSHGALSWKAPSVVVSHSCVLSWWRCVRHEPPPARYATYQGAVRAGLQQASAVVAPSRAMLALLEHYYGKLSKACVIHNGIGLSEFGPARKEPFVLGAGRLWDSGKNLVSLARVASQIDWPVRLAGATEGYGEDPVDFEGAQLLGRLGRRELAHQYAKASIFAHPARYEPFGLAPLEAAASGCALVLGDIDSLREVWGNAARYVPPDDLDALTATLNALIHVPSERISLAERARKRAASYGRDAMVRAYLDLYYGLVQTQSSERRPRSEIQQDARPH